MLLYFQVGLRMPKLLILKHVFYFSKVELIKNTIVRRKHFFSIVTVKSLVFRIDCFSDKPGQAVSLVMTAFTAFKKERTQIRNYLAYLTSKTA